MGWHIGPANLEEIIATPLLQERGGTRLPVAAETELFLKVHRQLARDPSGLFQALVEHAVSAVRAGSCGISLLNERGDAFVWPAIVGPLGRFVGGGTPRAFGPCGTVLDRNETLLMIRPHRHFLYLCDITPVLEEALLIPFHVGSQAVGTLWAVSHRAERRFDAEDQRVLEELSAFAASAYRTLSDAGVISSYLHSRAN